MPNKIQNNPPTVSSALLKSAVESLMRHGADPVAIKSLLGKKSEAFNDPDERFPMNLLVKLELKASELTGNPAIALHMGMACSREGSQSGVVGYIAANGPTLGDGFRLAIRYSLLLGDNIHVELKENETSAEFIYSREGDPYSTVFGTEFALSSTVAVLRNMGGDEYSLVEANFEYPVPEYEIEYRNVFGNNTKFNQSKNSIVFPSYILKQKSPKAQAYIKQILTRHAEELMEQMETESVFSKEVRGLIVRDFPLTSVSADFIADKLNISRQTMFRKLKTEGTSFKEILETTRKTLAGKWLRDRKYTITETAFILGFSESSAFNRAFKRWFGLNPGEYKKKN